MDHAVKKRKTDEQVLEAGFLENLPQVAFKRILYFLPIKDLKHMRQLSSKFEVRVSLAMPSIFLTFNIKYMNIRTLLNAMRKPEASKKMLKLKFSGQDDLKTKQILYTFNNNIVSLDIKILGREVFMLLPNFNCKVLENLSLDLCCLRSSRGEEVILITESLISKQATKLKRLEVRFLEMENAYLAVPDLPILDTLALWSVGTKAALNLINASSHYISTLNLRCTFTKDDQGQLVISPASVFQMPKLKHLKMVLGGSFQFILYNAHNLVSLCLTRVDFTHIPLNFPELPKLRELQVDDQKMLPLIFKATLEFLIYSWDTIDEDGSLLDSLVLPRLTDLILCPPRSTTGEVGRNIIRNNHQHLDYLFFGSNDAITNILGDDYTNMEKVKKVVLRSYGHRTNTEFCERIFQYFSNAEIIVLKSHQEFEVKMKSHCRSKSFNINFGIMF